MSILESLPTSTSQYQKLLDGLAKLSPEDQIAKCRNLCRIDLYFLLRYGLARPDVEKQWLLDRCREVQAAPNDHLDLWAREHYKSTIITFALTIQDILNDPEVTVGILSHTRPHAKQFLRQIKREFEANERLKEWFPDILWANPAKEAPKWSEDEGIIVKRRGNPKEATVEAWGLVDGQPTGKHFSRLVYDDTVVQDSVTTPDMIAKTTAAWELSDNLGTVDGKVRYIGTRYHYNDTYGEMIRRKVVTLRKYPATVDGSVDGEPVLLPAERLAEKRRKQGPYTFACQMLQDPKADETQGFKESWLKFYANRDNGGSMNTYIVVDAASAKKKDSDYTAIWVIGLGQDGNYYALDVVRDRLSLTQRADAVFALHRKWRPRDVGYEKYGMMADIEHIRDRQERENYRFNIVELGGQVAKADRIRRLIPLFEQGRVYLPDCLFKTNYEGKPIDLISAFIEEEYKPFPVAMHDDMLDALARILDENLGVVWPEQYRDDDANIDRYARKSPKRAGSWMAA